MVTIKESIVIERPVGVVYHQWTQFEDFPLFMRMVKQVEQIDDVRTRWKAQLAGKIKEWVAVIAEQVPDKHATIDLQLAALFHFSSLVTSFGDLSSRRPRKTG